ncbi:MAG: hypothetical protein CMI16_02815 [Opitutaceae bacterium]|nr:hypothetical protein [Opitutaceae bacterium]
MQIDAGEIVMVNTSMGRIIQDTAIKVPIDHGQRMRVGVGTNSFGSVRTLEEINRRLFEARHDNNRLEYEALSWVPDGVCISSEVDGPEFEDRTHSIVNVGVYGPTPLINDDERRAFSQSEHNMARIYVALAFMEGKDGYKYCKFVRFSTHDVGMHEVESKPILGDDNIKVLLWGWCIGRLMDTNLGMRFQNSGLIHVNISPLIQPFHGETVVSVERDGRSNSMYPPFNVTYQKEEDLLVILKNRVGTRESS